MLRHFASSSLALVLSCALVHAGDPWQVRLLPLNALHRPSFGEAVAFGGSGVLLAVGAPDAAGTGVVVIFRREAGVWVQEAALAPLGMAPGARFGAALYMRYYDGTGTAILDVGAPHASPGGLAECGEVRTYQRDATGNWSPRWTVTSDQPVAGGHFGAAVLGTGWLFVGEPGNGAGRVTRWTNPQSPEDWFVPSGAVANERFGAALAPSGYWPAASIERHLYIGAPGARGVYWVNYWHDVFNLHSYCSDPTRPGFGRRLASRLRALPAPVFLGEDLAVGHDGPGVEVWSEDFGTPRTRIASLSPFDSPAASAFGADFAFSGSGGAGPDSYTLIVGDPLADMAGSAGSGGAYRVGIDGGVVHERGGLAGYSRLPLEGAGSAVAANGALVALGAPAVGVVHVFDWSGTLGDAWCASEPNSRGATPVVYALGSAQLADRRLGFMAVGLPPHESALLVGSRNATSTPLGFGQAGLRCVDAPFVRFVPNLAVADAGGRVILRIDPLDMPGGVSAAVGETWTFQLWYRDAAAALPMNTTHAVRVTFE